MIIAIFIASMLVGIVVGLSIATALLLCTVATALALDGGDADPTIIAHTLMQGLDSVIVMVLPFLVLMGEIMNRDGLMKHITAFHNIPIGRTYSGLGYATILVCLMFASLVGSAIVACTALGTILIPMMADSGYNREKTAALTVSANSVAPIILSSVPVIVYGIAAGVLTKSLSMGDIAPAVYLTIIAGAVWFFVSHKKGVTSDMETVSKPTPKEAAKIVPAGLRALLLPVAILVGLRSGYFTATEAGATTCVYVILIGLLVYHEAKIKDLMKASVASAKVSAVVMFLATAANCAAYFMMISRVPQMTASSLEGLVERPTLLMLVLMYIVVVVGLTMGVVPSILIFTPIIFPLIKAAGIDPVYFGIVSVLMNVLGLTSPSARPILNVACATDKMKMGRIILPIISYFIVQTVLCSLLALVSALVEVPLRWFGG